MQRPGRNQSDRTKAEGQTRQKTNTREHLAENEHARQSTVQRKGESQSGKVKISLERHFGIWFLNAQKAGESSLTFMLKAVGKH